MITFLNVSINMYTTPMTSEKLVRINLHIARKKMDVLTITNYFIYFFSKIKSIFITTVTKTF